MTQIDRFINDLSLSRMHGLIKLGQSAEITRSTFAGAAYLEPFSRVGDSEIGRYCSLGFGGSIKRATVGNFCCFGPGVHVNPFNHPMDWLSVHEFQYNPTSYAWVPEYVGVKRMPRESEAFERRTIGSDVWIGAHAVVMANVGHGAIIGAGSVVTHDVPPFAIVAGNPAKLIRYRFSDEEISRLLASQWWEKDLPRDMDFRDIEKCLEQLERLHPSPNGYAKEARRRVLENQ